MSRPVEGNGGVVNQEGNGPEEQSPDEIDAELKRVEAERDELEARVETLEAQPQKRRRLRRIVTPILVALTVLVFTVTVPAVWGARTVLNTDRYVATVGPLAADPAVQASIATKLTDQVFLALNVEGTLSSVLGEIGERATVLAAPLTTAAVSYTH
jgi:cell division protein FtsB